MPTIFRRLINAFRRKPDSSDVRERLREAHQEGYHRGMKAKIDAAQSTEENRKHWQNVDSLGPNAAFDETVRAKLRNRSRYETLNNCYLKGLNRTLAYDLIGIGPRPQISFPTLKDGGAELAQLVEAKFAKWAKREKMARKYRTMHKSACSAGAGIILLARNPSVPDNDVQTSLLPIEIDQLTTPLEFANDPNVIDGIRIDSVGNPVEYYFLRQHPGENRYYSSASTDYDTIPAEQVLHWYIEDRPNQQHGIPEYTPAIPLFNQLRRWSNATLTAAEFAAMIAGIMKTNLPAAEGQQVAVENWDFFELVRGALMALPHEYDATQMKAEHPNTTFAEFERAKLNEAGRSGNSPLNVTTGNSSGYNFSSARCDFGVYYAGHWIDRDDFQTIVSDRAVRAWGTEARLIRDYLPPGVPPVEDWVIETNWDGFPEIDQNKAAQAADMRLKNGTETLAGEAARDGANWRERVDQLAVEIEYCKSKGVAHPFTLGGATDTASITDEEGETTTISIPRTEQKPEGLSKQGSDKAAARAGDVQGTALNGAQIASLIAVTDKLSLKQYPADAAEKIIQAAFPLMDRALIAAFINSLDKFEAPVAAEPKPNDAAKALAETNGHARIGGLL